MTLDELIEKLTAMRNQYEPWGQCPVYVFEKEDEGHVPFADEQQFGRPAVDAIHDEDFFGELEHGMIVVYIDPIEQQIG